MFESWIGHLGRIVDMQAHAEGAISMHFDDDNITTPEEILMTGMEQLMLKRQGPVNPFNDHLACFE